MVNIQSHIFLFADDTCLFVSGNDPADTARILNRDLEVLNNWSKKWKVSFNPDKTKDIIFSQNKVLFNSPPVLLDGEFVC